MLRNELMLGAWGFSARARVLQAQAHERARRSSRRLGDRRLSALGLHQIGRVDAERLSDLAHGPILRSGAA